MNKLLLALLAALSASSAMAFEIGVAPRVGTNGYGLDLVTSVVPDTFNLRLGAYSYKLQKDFDNNEATFDTQLQLKSAGLFADYHLFSGHLRLSAGALYNGNQLDVKTKPNKNGQYVFNGNTYNASDFRGEGSLTFKKFAPYVGIGGGNNASSSGNWSFLWDIGAMYQNKGKVKLNAEILNPLAPQSLKDQFAADLQAEEADLQKEVDKYKWYPVVSIGVGYKF